MKILLVCAGGMSTSMLLKRMRQYWKDQGVELLVDAVGLSEFVDVYHMYDIILAGPQVSYRVNEIREATQKPTAAIPSFHYAIGDCVNIMKLAKRLYKSIEGDKDG